jgi:hypothetical protein
MTTTKASDAAQEKHNRSRWHRAARSRLRTELSGLAFAVKHGFSPEEYARHLWDRGAVSWMGKKTPTPREYLETEVERAAALFPWVDFQLAGCEDGTAILTLGNGCLGSWQEDHFALAHNLGLTRQQVCRYCQEAFRVWSQQLGLDALPLPKADYTCSVVAAPLEADKEATENRDEG